MDFPGPTQKQAHLIWFAVTAFAVASTLALIGLVLWGLGFVLSLLSLGNEGLGCVEMPESFA